MKEEIQNIDELIMLYLTGEAGEKEIMLVKDWIHESDENFKYYTHLKTVWLLSSENKNPNQFHTQKALLSFKQKVFKNKSIVPVFLKYAAIFVIALTLGGFIGHGFVNQENNKNVETLVFTNEAEAPYGVRSKVNLPDGSQVWLNSGSKLLFPSTFKGNTRNVKLIGEAYFEVHTDVSKPFIVNANGVNVKALGTSFNVKSYPDESYVETTLVEGKVVVSKENSKEEPVTLEPNQKVTIYKPNPQLEKNPDTKEKISRVADDVVVETNVNTQNNISWRNELWIIDNEPLSSFAKKLERRYNVKIEIKDSTIYNFRYSGSIKDESINNVLEVLTLTSPIAYSKEENKIIFDLNDDSRNKFKNAWK